MKKHWFNKSILLALALVVALTLFAISCMPETEAAKEIGVVVTILPQADFVEKVGGEKVDVTVMVPPGASPHTYAPTPSQLAAVKQANMYAKVGSGVEFELVYMDRITEANKDMLVVDCSQDVDLMGKDPHIWLSPRNAIIMVENICSGLIQIDPENREYYTQNKNEYLIKLNELDEDIQSGLTGITNRSFMVFHPSWGYFARDYDLTQIPIEEQGKAPTAAGITKLIEQARANNIKVVFVSPQFDAKSARAIAKAIDGKVTLIDPLDRAYINNMHIVLGELT